MLPWASAHQFPHPLLFRCLPCYQLLSGSHLSIEMQTSKENPCSTWSFHSKVETASQQALAQMLSRQPKQARREGAPGRGRVAVLHMGWLAPGPLAS